MRNSCRIGIVDYGRGNLLSVANAIEIAGGEAIFCETPEKLYEVDKIFLPGVGSFGDCINALRTRKFEPVLKELVIKRGKPYFGTCLGMQIMAKKGFEFGEYEGLGWIEAEVVRLPPERRLRIPHMGWHDIEYDKKSSLFSGLPEHPDVYFAHSYYMKCNRDEEVDAICEYGIRFAAAIRKNNMFGTQFHPEKSQAIGLKLLENFIRWSP